MFSLGRPSKAWVSQYYGWAVWYISENAALFERLMKLHSNLPILYGSDSHQMHCYCIICMVWLQVMTVMIYIFFDTAPPQPAKFIRHGPILNYAHVRVCFWCFLCFISIRYLMVFYWVIF